MSIKRNDIKAILPDIEDDAMKNLLNLIHEEADALKDELDTAKNDLAKAQNDLKAANTEKEKAENALNDYKVEQVKKETKARKDAAAADLAKEAGVAEKYIRFVLHESGADNWELGDDGKIKDAKGLIETIKKDFADYVSTTTVTGAQVDNPPTGSGGITVDQFRKMSLDERIKLKNEHPEDYKRLRGK